MSNNSGASSPSSSSSSSSSRVSIPNNVRKTIQHIKEITSNHSEEDIYSMLKDCSMDPNETTQRLLHLDTFHEVKRKRDKRKELQTVKSRPGEDSRWKPGQQGRGTRNARGNSFSQYISNDVGGQRTAAIRKENGDAGGQRTAAIRKENGDAGGQRFSAIHKENGVEESRVRGFRHPPPPISKGADSIQLRNLEKSSSIVNGPLELSNGTLSGSHGGQSTYPSDKKIDASADNAGSVMPKANAENAPSASDPVLVPPCDLPITTDGSIKREVGIQHMSADTCTDLADRGNHLNQHEPQNVDSSQASSSSSEKQLFEVVEVAHPKILGECPSADKSHVSDSVTVVKPSSRQGVKGTTTKLEKLKFSDGEHVIIPQHIQVPDAVKNVLSFGSLDACFEVRENCVVAIESNGNSDLGTDSAQEETVSKLSSRDQDGISASPQAIHADHLQPASHLPGNNSPIDTEVSSSATVPKADQPKQETLPAVGPPFPVVQTAPSYTFGFMPPMVANMLAQPEGFESQTHVSNSLSSTAVSTSVSTPPPTQSDAGQSSVAVSPQPIPLFRHPYPPNYIPYSHYFSPYYVPPTMHQYYGHTAFPQPLPTGNMYLPPPTAAAGMKLSPHFKPGSSTGNQVPLGVPSGYGAYSTAQVAYSQNAAAAATSGNSNGEDLGSPALKENNIFPGQQSEGSAAWLHPAAGRDTTSFPLNPFLNLPQQGQHILNPQSGPGGFALYHAMQPMGSPAPGLPLLQQSQPVAGSVESNGPPSNSYQQPQRQQQVNWNM
ncbi:GBF-interacting protein 1-like isoform X2 [Chenopodium quinoa]|uniref:GBF-interacting protein 1-like isoform X2 n=1 Tax=Chenopodium quinoa TaxID=63459 RepID=UPI000B786F62|nr:GBF-interacting protein 1-like isoform X2 [Chenopodium quinoa]